MLVGKRAVPVEDADPARSLGRSNKDAQAYAQATLITAPPISLSLA